MLPEDIHYIQTMETQLQGIIHRLPKLQKTIAERALLKAIDAHAEQTRKTGDPYIIHPISVAVHAWERYGDFPLFIAGLLHDTVEDCEEIEMNDIYDEFGDEIGFLVDAVSKNTPCFYKNISETEIAKTSVEKLLQGGLHDPRVLILKLLDRENNLETIDIFRETKQIRLSFETQAIYKPLSFLLTPGIIEEKSKMLADFFTQYGVFSIETFKQYLFEQSFKGNANIDFDILYKNSFKIIWEIDDKPFYLAMCEHNQHIVESHEIIEMQESTSKQFHVRIKFTKAFSWEHISGKTLEGVAYHSHL